MARPRRLLLALAVLAAALSATAPAHAKGGDYVFDGGTAKAQAEVKAALDASAFDWSLVPVQVTIHISRDARPHATPGEIWLDPRLLASGRFSWGIVQHEYAHQVAFFLFGGEQRELLVRRLGAKAWCYEVAGVAHRDQACERFAATLAWSYWPSADNTEKPASKDDESAAIKPARFRALLAELVGVPALRAPARR